jgi:hypothetical protein
MEIEQALNDYRNGDADKRMCLFLTYREFRDEFSRIDEDKAVDQSPILWSPTVYQGDMIEWMQTFLSKRFRRPKSCCFVSAGAGRIR